MGKFTTEIVFPMSSNSSSPSSISQAWSNSVKGIDSKSYKMMFNHNKGADSTDKKSMWILIYEYIKIL